MSPYEQRLRRQRGIPPTAQEQQIRTEIDTAAQIRIARFLLDPITFLQEALKESESTDDQ